jgi:hypothetical protein
VHRLERLRPSQYQLFRLYGWANGSGAIACLFRKVFCRVRPTHHGIMPTAGTEARPHQIFHHLQVSQRLMIDCFEKFSPCRL